MAETLQFFIDRPATPLGEGVLISDGEGALRLFYWDDPGHRWRDALRRRYGEVMLVEKKNAFGHAKALKDYFDGDVFVVDKLKVAFAGSPFQKKVWNALRRIVGGSIDVDALHLSTADHQSGRGGQPGCRGDAVVHVERLAADVGAPPGAAIAGVVHDGGSASTVVV